MLPNHSFASQASFPENSRPDSAETFAAAAVPGGFCPLPNWILDRLQPVTTAVEFAIATKVVRMTAGWHREFAAISLATFEEAAGIDTGRKAVAAALDVLIATGVLIRHDRPGFRPLFAVTTDPERVDWQTLTERRTRIENEKRQRTASGRLAAARARGESPASDAAPASIPASTAATPPASHQRPQPAHPRCLDSRGTPTVQTAGVKDSTETKNREGRGTPPALDFSSRQNSAEKMPDSPAAPAVALPSPVPASSAANAPATPLADVFDAERRAIVGRLAPVVPLIPMPSADRPRIEAQLAAAAVTLAEVPALVAWIAAHAWDKRRDLLRHCGPMAHEKVTLPLVNDWRADTATATAAPLPKFDPAAEQRRDAEARADRERQAQYLAALRAGALPDRATVEAGCDVTITRVQGWRRDANFIAAERAAFDAGAIIRAEQARSRPQSRRDWRNVIAGGTTESEAVNER